MNVVWQYGDISASLLPYPRGSCGPAQKRRVLLSLLFLFPLLLSGSEQRDPDVLLAEADRFARLGNGVKARPLYAEAEDIYVKRGDSRKALYAKFGRLHIDVEGLSYVDVSNYLAEELENPVVQGDSRLKLRCLVFKGIIDLNTNTAAARYDWNEVLALAKTLGDKRLEARATGWLGILAFIDGNTGEASKMVTQAILSTIALHDIDGQITFLTYFGNGLIELNRSEQALAAFEQALKVAASDPDVGFPLRTYIGNVAALRKLNRSKEAQALLESALDYARRNNILGAQADLLLQYGLLAEDGHDPQAARRHYEELGTIASKAKLPRLEAEAMFNLANLDKAEGNLPQAEQYASRGIEAIREVGEPYQLPHYLAVQAELKEASGKIQEADALFSEATDLVEGMLVHVTSPIQESSLIGVMSEIYVGHFRLAIGSLKDTGKAFRILEHARGSVMADALRAHQIAGVERPWKPTPVESEIVALQRQLRQHHTPNERKVLLEKLDEEEAKLGPIEYERHRSARFFRGEPADLQRLRRSLRADEVILEYVLGEPTSYCLAISREAVRVYSLPAHDKIQAWVGQYLSEVKAKKSGAQSAAQLYNWLLGDILPREKKIRLTIVPDRDLNRIPFDSLLTGDGKYLLESHIVSYAPSSTVLHLLRTSSRKTRAHLPFLGIGFDLPVKGNEIATNGKESVSRGLFDLRGDALEPLPFARHEVTSAAAVGGQKSVVLLGEQATEGNLKSQPLADFQILHFAVHGIDNAKEPDRSGLVLRPDPKSNEDGLLQAREIRQLALNAELVTLSACNTGVGKLEGVEGVANLVRAFLVAGARSVVASLWPADDRLTATLMGRFYSHMAEGMDKSAALNKAKLDILENFGRRTVPYYWAPFILVGEGATKISSPRSKGHATR